MRTHAFDAVPDGLLSRGYLVVRDDAQYTRLGFDDVGGAAFVVEGARFEVEEDRSAGLARVLLRTVLLRAEWRLLREGVEVGRARRRGGVRERFELSVGGREYLVRRGGARTYAVLADGVPAGSASGRGGRLTRGVRAELDASLPPEVHLFLLVLLTGLFETVGTASSD